MKSHDPPKTVPLAAAVLRLNRAGVIEAVNDKAEQLTGLAAAKLVGRDCHAVFSNSTGALPLRALCQPLPGDCGPTRQPVLFHDPLQPQCRAMIVSVVPLPDRQPELTGALLCLQDASESYLAHQMALDSVADGVFTVNEHWEITSFNRAAEKLTGWSRQEVMGKPCAEIFHSSICGGSCLLHESIRLQTPLVDRSIFIRTKDGHPLPVSINAAPLYDLKGHIIGGIETFRDVSESLKNDLILDSIADGVFTVDSDWTITSFNRAAEEITGWSRQEVMGKPCSEIFHSSICGDNCLLRESIANKTPIIDRGIYIKTRNGGSIPVSISASPLLDQDGEVIGGIETFRDVSESLKNDLVLDSIVEGVFTVNDHWEITSFNRAAEKLTGWSRREVLGRPCSEIFCSSICGDNCLLRESIAQKKLLADHSIFIKTRDNRTLPVSISVAPLLDHDGEIIGGIETFRDVSDSLKNDLIIDSVADGVFTVDRNWRITSFNRAAEEITGWTRQEAMGKSCGEIFHSSICGRNCAIAESLYSARPVANRSITIRNRAGQAVPVSISAAPLTDHEGNIIGGVETFRDLTAITNLRQELHKSYTFDEIISKSSMMQRIFRILPDISRSMSTVLILGESGTGKELIARAIFNASSRSDRPFVTVNCGALPETLLESELFGYKAGAFTDAKKDRPGRFAAAEGGTLFLDEIGELPPAVQVKLLRVLQQKVYEALGSNTPIQADVRIITATNRDLQALVREGLFREDLFYRLNVVKILLPPLRERKEDIPLLIEHFIHRFSALQGKEIIGIASPALALLMQHDYPGNIRELENIIEYAFILCDGGYIMPEHLPAPFAPGEAIGPKDAGEKPLTLEAMEKQAIIMALERNKWRKMAVCRATYHMYVSAFPTPPRLVYRTFVLSHPVTSCEFIKSEGCKMKDAG